MLDSYYLVIIKKILTYSKVILDFKIVNRKKKSNSFILTIIFIDYIDFDFTNL